MKAQRRTSALSPLQQSTGQQGQGAADQDNSLAIQQLAAAQAEQQSEGSLLDEAAQEGAEQEQSGEQEQGGEQAVAAPRVSGRPALKNGNVGSAVSALQTALNVLSNAGLVIDGSFGPATAAAVRAFQVAAGLVADAIVGPKTAGKINEGGTVEATPEQATPETSTGGSDKEEPETDTSGRPAVTGDPLLSFNSRGSIVSALQNALNKKGATMDVDGVFGAQTDYAVRQFQRANGLSADGVVGPGTAGKLNDPTSKDIPKATQPKGGGEQSDFEGNEAYDTLRDAVIGAAESHMGAPYYWGADGPGNFDCSGFVLFVLRQDTGLVSWGDDTAAGISGRLPGTAKPKKGDPVFYRGSSGISHVEMYMGTGSQTIGASGGGSKTFGNNPKAKVQYGDYSRDGRSKSFGSIDGLIQAKLAASATKK